MDKETVLKIGKEIIGIKAHYAFQGKVAEFKNLISSYCGKNNPFYEAADKLRMTAVWADEQLESVINAFLRSVEFDLISNVSFERKLKITVVNDFLNQAEEVLQKKELHPAVAAFLIGASLEEFLRTWVLEQNLSFDEQKPTIDTYSKVLRQNEFIDKQDFKDITAWAGIRNNAAHGLWELVKDKEKVNIMLAGVNNFIRKYSN